MSPKFVRRRPWGRVEFDIDDPDFLRTSNESVRRWLLYRLLSETVADLEAMDGAKDDFVPGSQRPLIGSTRWSSADAQFTPDELVIAGQQVMQEWERPLMEAMVDLATAAGGDVLEVGFGMGISAELIQQRGVRSHTIIELSDEVFARARQWQATRPGADIRLLHGGWQDLVGSLEKFDSVFYDAYPVSDDEVAQLTQVPFPDQFFRTAAALLREGGVFTYYTNEIDSLSRWHQRALLDLYSRFEVRVIRGLRPPPDCHYWWAPSMAMVGAYR